MKHHPNPRGWLWEALEDQTQEDAEDMEVRTVPLDELFTACGTWSEAVSVTTFRPTHPGRTGGSSASGWRATAIRRSRKMGMTEIQCRVRLFA